MASDVEKMNDKDSIFWSEKYRGKSMEPIFHVMEPQCIVDVLSLLLMNKGSSKHLGFWKMVGGYRRGIGKPIFLRYNIGRNVSGWQRKIGWLI